MKTNGRDNLRIFTRPSFFVAVVALVHALGLPAPIRAQLQVTEVMIDPLDTDVWQWIEVRNLDPNNAVDLNGAYADRLGNPRILPGEPAAVGQHEGREHDYSRRRHGGALRCKPRRRYCRQLR